MPIVKAGANIDFKKFQRSIFTEAPKALTAKLNKALFAVAKKVEREVKNNVFTRITDSPEYRDLQGGGKLRGELGIENLSDVDAIIQAWIDSIHVQVKKLRTRKGVKLDGGLLVFGIDGSFFDVINSPTASYTTYNKGTRKTNTIPWLDWLLIRGPEVLVFNYGVVFDFDSSRHNSRTGIAIMASLNSQLGKNRGLEEWSVPSEFQGVESNNWVTRALGLNGGKPIGEDVASIIDKGLRFRLR